jgi:hypothetical protein
MTGVAYADARDRVRAEVDDVLARWTRARGGTSPARGSPVVQASGGFLKQKDLAPLYML